MKRYNNVIIQPDSWRYRLPGRVQNEMEKAIGSLKGLSPREAEMLLTKAKTPKLTDSLEEAADRAGLVDRPPWVPVRQRGVVCKANGLTGQDVNYLKKVVAEEEEGDEEV